MRREELQPGEIVRYARQDAIVEEVTPDGVLILLENGSRFWVDAVRLAVPR